MILVDSREKKNQHILDYFAAKGITYTVQKLSTGDYMDTDRPHLTIDRKQNLEELSGNICTADNRFWREVRRSHEEGLRMIVLIEHGGRIRSMNDVPEWKSKFTKVTGQRLFQQMLRIHMAYGVEFLFCDKNETGRRVLELLRDG